MDGKERRNSQKQVLRTVRAKVKLSRLPPADVQSSTQKRRTVAGIDRALRGQARMYYRSGTNGGRCIAAG